jgi:serine/threonine-protein kinase TTK/MPS1
LKPANFLLVSGRLKLIDFGIASSIQSDMTSVFKDMATGTFNYMSPEAIQATHNTNGNKSGFKVSMTT